MGNFRPLIAQAYQAYHCEQALEGYLRARPPYGTSQPTPAVSVNDSWAEVFLKGPKGLVGNEEGKEVEPRKGDGFGARWMGTQKTRRMNKRGDLVSEWGARA